ncbi:pyridoxamine 5'-phosphate oxidase family protein [Knoellia subterranea]|uniref:Pyridoxamine 5'-phosphate oxidase n=1 Tax=Knoellia subterranea KCTC 19937 TaxID=1385521 RepID=A0A0A0JK30_9MICO|nr:pyridoxamine 5'-phosphate oxidase family protein [Knoellia subterranea]KGN37785.1 pyridoxamine 5'-phosphate oxidase [Knoellia subterranea KCTC 19937]
MDPAPRSREARLADTRARLENDIDVWVATASSRGGAPGLVPLSFDWDGASILLATGRSTPAGRNLRETGDVRLALGGLRDVVMIDGSVVEAPLDSLPEERWDAYAVRTGWDPRAAGPDYAAYVVTPTVIQAWREYPEIADRTLMKDGRWLD